MEPAQPVCDCSANVCNCADLDTYAPGQARHECCASLERGDVYRLHGGNEGIPGRHCHGGFRQLLASLASSACDWESGGLC